MKRLHFLTILLWLCLGYSSSVFGQFQYVGVDAQLLGGTEGSNQFALSFGWLKQTTAHHGFGVDLSLPILFNSNLGANPNIQSTHSVYDTDMIWTRKALPAVAGRYRYFIGNAFFIGSSLQLGLVKERFFADRLYYESASSYTVDPVYLDYEIVSPYVRLNFETGFVWNMGSLLYGTLQGRMGIQGTKSKVPTFGTFEVDYNKSLTFDPYKGIEFFGGGIFGLGVKF